MTPLRVGPIVARSALFRVHQRLMASTTTTSDPIQRLFLDKIKEFKNSNKGLDQAHEKAMSEELNRLKHVYNVEEAKLTQLEFKFPKEHNVSLHDLDDNKELRAKIMTGEYQKELSKETKPRSALLDSIPTPFQDEFHLPLNNHPDERLLEFNAGPKPVKLSNVVVADYETTMEKYTPEKVEEELRVSFGKNMPTIDDDKSPQRDLVNFPTQKQNLDTPPTRFHIIPESWFQFFYPKTGLTGPYTFAFTFSTFLFSKEWMVVEHEFGAGVSSTIIFAYAIKNYGPMAMQWYRKKTDNLDKEWEDWRVGNIDTLQKLQDSYKDQLSKSKAIDDLYQIRETDLQNQIELEHRSRLQRIHAETQRRLNYLVAVANSQKQIAHKFMVNWVISNAIKSIGQKQENDVLDSCIANLKQMGVKNANAI